MNDLSLYEAVKCGMKTGDLLQWHTHAPVSFLIRWRTQSVFNHSSMVICLKEYEGLERKRFTQEALSKGVILNRLGKRLEAHHGEVWWFPLKDEWNEKRQLIGERALDQIGIPYDFKSIGFQLFGHVSVDDRALFCSEAYAKACGHEGEAPSPGDLISLGWHKEGVRIL